MFPAAAHYCAEVFRRSPGDCVPNPHSNGYAAARTVWPWAEQAHEGNWVRKGGVLLYSCSLGLEKTRSFSKLVNKFPKFFWAFDGFTPPIRLTGLCSSAAPSVAPSVPCPQQFGAGGMKGGVLIPLAEQRYNHLECEEL